MALSEAALKKLTNGKIVSLALEYQHKFDSTLESVRNELSVCS